MVLTTHAIVGASVASLLPSHPILGFTAGFASHFLLDAIPHWDYHLLSAKKDYKNPMNDDLVIGKKFYFDLVKMAFDACLGVFVALILFLNFTHFNFYSILISTILWGAIGGLFPDFLQFVYFKIWRREPLLTLQKFHIWLNRPKHLKNRPLLGASLQIILIVVVVSIFKFVF